MGYFIDTSLEQTSLGFWSIFLTRGTWQTPIGHVDMDYDVTNTSLLRTIFTLPMTPLTPYKMANDSQFTCYVNLAGLLANMGLRL